MNWYSEEDKLLRRYLLDDVTAEERRLVEDRLLSSDEQNSLANEDDLDFVDRLLLAEDELIDDYACEALSPHERALFEKNFLLTPKRRNRLAMTKEFVGFAVSSSLTEGLGAKESISSMTPPKPTKQDRVLPTPQGKSERVNGSDGAGFWQKLFVPGWKVALAGLLLVGFGIGSWWLISADVTVATALKELNRAYRTNRPLEARISGFGYAKFSQQRGNQQPVNDQNIVDRLARDRAERILLDAVAEHPNSATRHGLGRMYLVKREFDRAIELFSMALQEAPNNAMLHADLGAALLEKIRDEGAENSSRHQPELINRTFSELNQAMALDGQLLEPLFNRALLYQLLGLNEPASESWKKYLDKDKASPWADEARRNLEELQKQSSRIGQVPDNLYAEFLQACRAGDNDQAWKLYNRGYLRYGNHISTALVDSFLDLSAADKGAAAMESLNYLLRLGQMSEQRTGDRFITALALVYEKASLAERRILAQARWLRKEAHQLSSQSKHDQAIEYYNSAKNLFARAGARVEAIVTEHWIGESHLRLSEHHKSLVAFSRVAQECQREHYRWWQAMARNRLASVHSDLEEFSLAVQCSLDARQIFTQLEDENGALRSLIILSGLYRDTGQSHRAIQVAHQALLLAGRLDADERWLAMPCAVLAGSFGNLELFAAALEFQKEAVRVAEWSKNPQAISRYHVQLGLLYERSHNLPAAIREISLGLEAGAGLAQAATEQDIRNYAMLHLGRVYRKAGDYQAALRCFEEASRFYQQRNHGEGGLPYLIEKERLLVQIAIGHTEEAQQNLTRVLGRLESNRKKILQESIRNSFFDTQQGIYDAAIKFTQATLRKPDQALEYSELSRSRSLLDATRANYQTTNDGSVLDLTLSASTPPMPVSEIKKELSAQAQILQFAVLDDRIICWVISKGSVQDRVLGTGASALTEKVNTYLSRLARPPADGDDPERRKLAIELYKLLIAPVEMLLDSNKLLCIIPDKILCSLPYAALLSPRTGKYLIEDYVLLLSPSATLFIRASETAKQKAQTSAEKLLSVGNPAISRRLFPDLPDLPSSAREAEAIARLYSRSDLLIGADVRKEALLAKMANAEIVHLAMHYVADERTPMLSSLVLAAASGEPSQESTTQNQLAMYEVYRLKLAKTKLVVLSACQTGIEEYFNGEGAIGLARPFAAAGVPLIVASLWPVDSEATQKLMVAFHKLRRGQHIPTPAALREAQLALLRGPQKEFQHPYYWAAFAVTGGYGHY